MCLQVCCSRHSGKTSSICSTCCSSSSGCGGINTRCMIWNMYLKLTFYWPSRKLLLWRERCRHASSVRVQLTKSNETEFIFCPSTKTRQKAVFLFVSDIKVGILLVCLILLLLLLSGCTISVHTHLLRYWTEVLFWHTFTRVFIFYVSVVDVVLFIVLLKFKLQLLCCFGTLNVLW